MLDLNELSTENLKRIQKILKILLDELELQEINRLSGNKITLKMFEREGFYYDEVKAILNKINGIEVENDKLKELFEDWGKRRSQFPSAMEDLANPRPYALFRVSEEDLDKYIILRIRKIEEIKKFKENADKKIQERTGTRAIEEKQEIKTGSFSEEVLKTEQLLDKIESDIKRKIGTKEASETDKLIDKLEEDINEKVRKNEETKKNRKNNLKANKQIRKITIIEMKNGKRLIAVNDNYNEAKPIKNTEWWGIFIKEIKERGMINRTNIKQIPKGMFDYFNYNNGKCPIYMGGKYDLTDIFVGRDIDTAINPEVKTKIMTETQYLTRKNRKK